MRPSQLFALGFALLAACQNNSTSGRRPSQNNRRPPAATRDVPTPSTTVSGTGASEPDAAQSDAGSGPGVFLLGQSACVHDPARNSLGVGTHGFFSGTRLEMEIRNVRFSCTPVPSFAAEVEGNVVHMRFHPAERAALTRCNCRHDQFLQVTNIPTGEYDIRVEEITDDDGGVNVIGTGRIVATAESPAPAAVR